ncbi:sodium:alanine symporter family protein, partial [Staphylococcus pseudintermedius]|uniref:alanine:cation symporter family protein n=1 Tax=Staphylococcus pseudintermedius TaxID=283734 RepID=UPI000E363717
VGFTVIMVMHWTPDGVSKCSFSNEAGLGTVALISGNAKAVHPPTQVLVAIIGTFIVTIIVCTMTGLVLLVKGYCVPIGGLLSGVSHDAKFEAGSLTSI